MAPFKSLKKIKNNKNTTKNEKKNPCPLLPLQ
jgi:hypothetical protein